MKLKPILFMLFTAVLCYSIFAEIDTLVFQNGTNNYIGCIDSYMDAFSPDQNNGDWRQLFTAN